MNNSKIFMSECSSEDYSLVEITRGLVNVDLNGVYIIDVSVGFCENYAQYFDEVLYMNRDTGITIIWMKGPSVVKETYYSPNDIAA